MSESDPASRAAALARELRVRGHAEASAQLDASVERHKGGGLLEALREACQIALTAVETLDPSAYALIEELRMDVDKRLDTGRTSG